MDGSMENAAAAEPAKMPVLRSAKLFSAEGRMFVTVLELRGDAVVATTQVPPRAGSIAVLARSGVRVPATVTWVDGMRFGLRLDEPLATPTLERFAAPFEPPAVH